MRTKECGGKTHGRKRPSVSLLPSGNLSEDSLLSLQCKAAELQASTVWGNVGLAPKHTLEPGGARSHDDAGRNRSSHEQVRILDRPCTQSYAV